MPDPKADDNVATEDNTYARPAFEVINVGAGDSLEIKLTPEYT